MAKLIHNRQFDTSLCRMHAGIKTNPAPLYVVYKCSEAFFFQFCLLKTVTELKVWCMGVRFFVLQLTDRNQEKSSERLCTVVNRISRPICK